MKFENTRVFNLESALRGMRNPKNSWDRSDSCYFDGCNYKIGEKDMKLAQTLIGAGNEHRKFLRQIFVSVDITGPLYWWKELDTYKIGTTANSTSTMHKIADAPITMDSFEMGDFCGDLSIYENKPYSLDDYSQDFAKIIVDFCETLRKRYLESKDVRYWKELIRWLPCGWLQMRTWTCNYEVLRNIYHQRKYHKLAEWHLFCEWIKTLPYAKELIID